MGQAASVKSRISEFDWLKLLALFLLVFVHSNLEAVYPEVILPLKWFMISCFFFVSGFLAFSSFRKREVSIRGFFKNKVLSLYVPFVAAVLLYFGLQTAISMASVDWWQLLSSVILLNIFLWFIPYLLLFMLIFCLLEKYVKNARVQVLVVLVVWFLTILAWAFDTELRLGLLFTQYFLVFMIGVWMNKLELYGKVINFKTALVTIPLIILFSLDFSNLLTFNTATETLTALLYSNGRSIILSLSAILLVLFVMQKLRLSRNHFVELIAGTSIFIYLLDPFFAYLLSNYVFGEPTMFLSAGTNFYLYLTARIVVVLVLLPFAVKVIRNYVKR